MIELISFIPLLPCLANLFVLAYVYGQRRKTSVNHAYIIFSLFVFAVSLLEFLTHFSVTPFLSSVLLRMIGPVVFPLGFLFLNFVFVLIGKKRNTLYLILFILMVVCVFISLFIEHTVMPYHPIDIYPFAKPGLFFIVLFIIGTELPGVYAVWLCYVEMIQNRGKLIATQLRLLLIGSLVASFWAIGTLIFLPMFFGIQKATLYTSLGLLFNTYFTYLAVSKYYFLSINIAQLENSFEILLQNIHESVILFDQQGDSIQMNKSAYELLCVKESKVTHQFLNENILGYDFKGEYDNERVILRRGNEKRHLLLSQTNIHDKNYFLGKIVLMRDITEQLEAEQELQQRQNLNSLGQLAGGIAHDFNNYLTGIAASFSLARMELHNNDTVKEILTQGEKAAINASSLTHQLLTFSKGGAPIKKALSISDIVREAATFSVRGSNIKLLFNLPKEKLVVEADKGQMRQVFQNLILNAVQAMPLGENIEVTIALKILEDGQNDKLKSGSYAEIKIKDQGHGISKDIIGRIFEPYFTTKQNGSGLGLAMVYSIIKKHGGQVQVSSEPGEGAVFTVYLPLTSVACYKETMEPSHERVEYQGRILVMEDDHVVRLMLEKILTSLGFTVDISMTGEGALTIYDRVTKDEKYYAVITDLTVPGAMGGLQLKEELHKRDPLLKVIISSGYSEDEAIANYEDFGFFAAIRKPYTIDQLKSILGSAVL